MRRLSLKDILFDTDVEEECVHSFGDVWVVETIDDGYWQTSKDCKTVEPIWYRAKAMYVSSVNMKDSSNDVTREEEEDRLIKNPIEYDNMLDYTGAGYMGFVSESIHHSFEL